MVEIRYHMDPIDARNLSQPVTGVKASREYTAPARGPPF